MEPMKERMTKLSADRFTRSPVLDRFRHMRFADIRIAFDVGYRACEPEQPVVSTEADAERVERMAEQLGRIGRQACGAVKRGA
ncbi:hypothetical protein D3C84_782120 [compost metagenome]